MYKFRLLLILFSSSLCLSYSQSNPYLTQDKVDELVALPELTDQPPLQSLMESNPRKCLCIPQNQLSTTPVQLWDPENIGIERLVVYLYRTKETNAIKVYIPSVKKQIAIPDLPYENGDDISVQEDITLKRIFYDSSQIVMRNVDSQKVQYPKIINHYDINELNSNHDKRYDFDRENINTELHNYVVHILEHTTDTPSEVVNVEIPAIINSDKKSDNTRVTFTPKITVNSNVRDPTLVNLNFTDPVTILKPVEIVPHIPNQENDFWKKTNINTVIHNTDYDRDNTLDITFSKWFNEQMKHMSTDAYESSESFDISKLKYLIEKALRKSGFYVSDQGILIDSNGSHLNMANLMLRPILIGNSVAYENLIKGKEIIEFTIPKTWPHLPWMLITTTNPSKTLGMIPLENTYIPEESSKKLIGLASIHSGSNLHKPSLKDQEMYARKDSDSRVTFSNSKIADDISKNNTYDGRRLFNGKEKDKMKSHAKLYSKDNKPEPSQLKRRSSMKNELDNNSRIDPLAISMYALQSELNFDRNKARNNRDKHRVKIFPIHHSDRNEKRSNRKKIFKNYFNFNPNNRLRSSPMNKMFDEMNGNIKDEDTLKITDDYFEDIGFRIVGGGAATGSGAPISNKGRSGESETDVSENQPVANLSITNDEDVRLGMKFVQS